MPTYNYKYDSCYNISTVFKSISDSPLKKYDKCKGMVKRIISGVTGMIFKGAGFYLTDNDKSNNSKNKNLMTKEKAITN